MTDVTNVTNVEDDKSKPVKAIVATIISLVGLIWANLQGVEDWGTLDFQDWVTIVVPAILVFGGTFVASNPKVLKR